MAVFAPAFAFAPAPAFTFASFSDIVKAEPP